MFQQILYISTITPAATIVVPQILSVSQSNNARDGLSGLLFFNGKRFLQVLEGPENAMAAVIDRIRADRRHRAIVILSDRMVADREFGTWAMADGSGIQGAEQIMQSIEQMASKSAPAIRETFASYARLRTAA